MNIKECFNKAYLIKVRSSENKVRQSLTSARNSLKKARDNAKIKNMDVAVIMAYTAIFHAFRALLFFKGVKERSHVCMLEYVKTEFPSLKALAKEADAYRRFRHTALYGLDVLVSKDDASAAMRLGEKIINSVAGVLGIGPR